MISFQMREIITDLDNLEKDELLFRKKHFVNRIEVIDHIEYHILDRLKVSDEITQSTHIIRRAEDLLKQLENVNDNMFSFLREELAAAENKKNCLLKMIREYAVHEPSPDISEKVIGYDPLDLFLNGILTPGNLPDETCKRLAGMVYYQKTPGRIVLEMVKKASFQSNDVFFDLGSGIGQVVLLVNILGNITSNGIEFEKAFVDYARSCADALKLKSALFVEGDARNVDYSSGNVFFMHTPFEGEMLLQVLLRLESITKKRKIKIFTYGLCGLELKKQLWLKYLGEATNELDCFESI